VQSHQKLEVSFDAPSDGWVGVDLRIGDQHLFANVSHIYPGLRDLCAGLCDVVNGVASRPIVLYLEPSELELRFSPESSDRWRFTATIFPDRLRSALPPMITAALPSAGTVITFWRALRRLQTSVNPEDFATRFREPFPLLEMDSLTELLRRRKGAG
jgi:hypothetical protein